MTTRDPRRSRPSGRPESQGNGPDPTQSLSLGPEDEVDPAHPSLALGTSDAARDERSRGDERTRIESPQARSRTPAPAPARSPTRPPPIPQSDDPEQRVGTTLGSYRVLEVIGKGGMGFVYRAEHIKLAREVALKLLRSDYAQRKDAVARFIQEARTVNRVRHRNIVDVPDIIELEDGTTCIVMEFLRGQSLGKWARSGVDLPRALAVLVQICDGLSAAHAVSVVHRDLKPDNVIVVPTSDGAELVKLLDFGVAKLLNRDDEDIGFQTAAGSVIGTPAYMSPEQAGGMAIDARSDIYSLGAIMYELFCGQPMFRGRSFGEYVRKHLTELPVRPRMTPGGAQIDERLEAVILRALEKDPNLRYSHILELRDALIHLLGGFETSMSGIVPALGSVTASGVRPPPTYVPSLPAIPHLTTPSSGAHPSQHYSHYTSAGYSQIVGLPPPPQIAPTPWWVWLVGGTVAVGLGIGAAVWYAGQTEVSPIQAVAPGQAATPAPPPVTGEPEIATPPEPRIAPVLRPIELRFDSLPSGGVFADGRSAELCRTPCEVKIEPREGAEADTRTFVVKSEGYKDAVVTVDLTSDQRAFSVTLDQLAGAGPTSPDGTRPSGTTRPRPGSKAGKAGKAGDPTATTTKDPGTVVPKPIADPVPNKKPGDKIDRSDTLDPFRRNRP